VTNVPVLPIFFKAHRARVRSLVMETCARKDARARTRRGRETPDSMSGFQKKPFFATPDANCFVPLPQYREALNALCDWARAGEGIALLTSPPGLGKTLLCHRLALELGDRVRTVFLANASFGTPRQLLQTVLFRLDRPYAHRDDHELLLEFWKALKSLDAENRMLLLIVDDAHELSEDVLREFRVMLSNPGIGNPAS
jgi:MSHA biogenesis protein MshM